VKQHYSDVPIYVMANGVQEDPARFKDSLRVYYLYNYINEALKGDALLTHISMDGDGHESRRHDRFTQYDHESHTRSKWADR